MPINLFLDVGVTFDQREVPRSIVNELKKSYTRSNPKYFKTKNLGFKAWNIPREVYGYTDDGNFMTFPRGETEPIKSMLEERGYDVELHDDRVDGSKYTFKMLKELRDYQEEARNALIRGGSGILRGPCGSGKTVVLLSAIAARGISSLVVVHSRAIMDQWVEACADFLGILPGTMGGGKKTNIKLPITIAMQQSLWKVAISGKRPVWADRFGLLAGDECHHWAARTFQLVARMFRSRYFLGVSADERRKDGLEFLTEWTFGPMLHSISKSRLQEAGRLVPIYTYIIPTDYVDDEYIRQVSDNEPPDWVGMIDRLNSDFDRNVLVLNTVSDVVGREPDSRILMLNDRQKACKEWAARFRQMGISCGLLLGGPENKREFARTKAGLQSGSIQIGIGTSVADEGLDIPPLTHVAITCPGHTHPKRLEQQVGRAARPWKGKREAKVLYFWDRMMFPSYPIDDPVRPRAERRILDQIRSAVGGEIELQE